MGDPINEGAFSNPVPEVIKGRFSPEPGQGPYLLSAPRAFLGPPGNKAKVANQGPSYKGTNMAPWFGFRNSPNGYGVTTPEEFGRP